MNTRVTLPGDAEIRAALLARLGQRFAHSADTVVLEEVGLCRAQVFVDVAVVNGSLHGYEIKSDRDSLRRLATQAAMYGRVLDRVSLVVGPRHVGESIDAVPSWWEIQVATTNARGVRLTRLRAGRRNPARDARALVELLWREDALAFLESRGAARGYRGRPRREIWDRICELFSVDEIDAAVRARLKAKAGAVSPPPLA